MLDNLTKPQKNRLRRYECRLCELRLDVTVRGREGTCSAMHGRCEAGTIRKRAIECLKASPAPHIANVSNLECEQ